MGLFGQSSPFDADVEKATSETNTTDDWSLIMDVCDKVSTHPRLAKDCLKAVMRRMGHTDPHVVMQAITLLDACASNCGKPFHLEIASREFENDFRRLLGKAQPKVSLKMRQVLKNWAENDFKNDPELNLIPTLYNRLRMEGLDFNNLTDKTSSKSAAAKAAAATLAKDPNVVSSQQEEDDIAKAIELSLKETKSSPKQQQSTGPTTASTTGSAYPSLYPSFGGSSVTTPGNGNGNGSSNAAASSRTVRALYDFEAAEENELTFFAGEIIQVLDDSDANWWKGYNDRGEGLFPSNFVTADLSVDPERLDINQQHKNNAQKQAAEEEEALLQQKTEAAAAQPVEIDEAKIDRLLHLLHEANPEDPSQDSEEMLRLEQQVHQMGPLIDAELERVDRKHAQLTQLSSDLVDAINLYHTLMRDDRAAASQFGGAGFMPGGFPGAALYGAPGYPSTAGFPPSQTYPGMHSLPYTPPQGSNVPHATTAPSAAGYPGQVPMPYQNGHAPQLNSLPPHLTQTPAVGVAPSHPQPIYNAQPTPVTTQQQQQQQPPTNYHMPMPVEQQQQQQQQPQQMPPPSLPPQFAVAPPAATQMHQQPPPPQHAYMSPQHQQPAPQPQPGAPPQAYMPPGATAQPPQFYAPNGAPPVTQGYMAPPQQQQPPQHLQQQQQQPQQQQQQPPPQQLQQQQQQQHPPNHDHFSQLHQQMAAMSMGHHGGMPPAAAGAAPAYHLQNDAVKNNIPIYQQQR